MARRFLAFDIETAKDVPGEDFNWRPHRPLGISCAATLASPSSEVVLWHGKTNDGAPAPRMTRDDAAGLLQYLCKMAQDGFTILTWNGLGFDFDILAEEAAAAESCQACALCPCGYDVSHRLFPGLSGGTRQRCTRDGVARQAGRHDRLAGPQALGAGHHKDVLDYVSQDVRMAMQIAEAAECRRRFEWITRKGTKSKMPLPKGWLTVSEALTLPEPDTSWMSNPLKCRDFTGWFAGS